MMSNAFWHCADAVGSAAVQLSADDRDSKVAPISVELDAPSEAGTAHVVENMLIESHSLHAGTAGWDKRSELTF